MQGVIVTLIVLYAISTYHCWSCVFDFHTWQGVLDAIL